MRIYLAGGFNDWREEIKTMADQHVYRDPGDHNHVKDETAYTFLDLTMVDNSDMVVAYLDPKNPSLYGSSLEIGYAHAQGKPVILIDALTPAKDKRARWFGMARSIAEVVVPTISDAIEVLLEL